MARTALFDRDAVTALLARQNGVITRAQASKRGVSDGALQHRIRSGGPWRVLLPGVHLASTGRPSGTQWQTAGLLYAGPGKRDHRTGCAGFSPHPGTGNLIR